MNNSQLEIPYGVADFSAIQAQNMTYVDKTRFFAELERAGRAFWNRFLFKPKRAMHTYRNGRSL